MSTDYFQTKSIDLSMKNPDTGVLLTSNVYTLKGVTEPGSTTLKKMSIGQLVMAVCLSRATELEATIVSEMATMANTTDKLETYSNVEADLAAWQKVNHSATLSVADIKNASNAFSTTYPNLYATFSDDTKRTTFLNDIGMSKTAESWSADQVDEMMQNIEEQMDSLNTISQEQLIEIQSLTSKRDDTYSLISNVLKSLYTVLTGNVNNM